jgi:putative spermidine/putrescine transport system ATP-binding protein
MTALTHDKLKAQRTGNAPAEEGNSALRTKHHGPAASDLTLDRVTKAFKDTVAVRDVSFEAKSGEFISFLGPSGCGKTTTLSMIAGFQDVSSGAISIRGRRVDGLPPEKRNTGMVFQDYALFPHMSVAENVSFGLRMRYVPKIEIQERVKKALSLVRMSGFAERQPSQLSGGQKQRVALARALVIEPDVLLLDEPFNALDRQLREQMQFELKSLQQSIGITTVFVTHDQEEALLLSSRIAVMNQGEIQQIGTPSEIYEAPATTFVAQFIGKSNFIKGDVAATTSADVCIDTPAGRITALPQGVLLRERQTVECMVRPEKIQLLKPGIASDGECRLRGVVRQIAYHGASTQVILTLPGDIEFVTSQSSQSALAEIAAVGSSVDVTWPDRAVTLFIDGKRCQ